jgi:hypothetical protein
VVTLPLGVGAYERNYAGEPEVKLVNRFLEAAPTNLRERTALLARPGTNQLNAFGSGPIRGAYSKAGLFGGDLFVVSGSAIYRYDQAGVKTTITGLINGTGHPNVTWMKGIGYEFLFIADGLLLQYYSGGTQATGVLTYTPGAITTQVVEIGGVYYGWNADVDNDSPDGSAAHPWLAILGSDPLGALAKLINFDGVRGTDFSTALGGPNTLYTAASESQYAVGTLTLSGGSITNQVFKLDTDYYGWNSDVEADDPNGSDTRPWLALVGVTDEESLANMAELLNYDEDTLGTNYSSGIAAANDKVSATSTATTLDVKALSPGTDANSVETSVYSGSYLAWGATTLEGGSDSANKVTITAVSQYADGNSITTSVSGSDLAWGATTLLGGGTHALHGVPMPDGLGAKALATVSSFVMVSVANSQKFFWIQPGETTIDALDFAEKESNPDNIVDMLTVGDQVLVMGQGSTETWYATGVSDAPFQPVEGRVYARGCVEGTAVVVGDTVMLVGDDGVVYQFGYTWGEKNTQGGVNRISNHGIEERIRVQLRREQGYPP